LGYEKGVQLVSSAIKCRMHMTRPEKKDDLRDRVKSCIESFTETGRARMKYSVGEKGSYYLEDVCRTCFLNVYMVSSTHVDNIVKEIKEGCQSSIRDFNDKTAVPLDLIKPLKKLGKSFGIHLSNIQLAALVIPK
jgi:hypothetical protein